MTVIPHGFVKLTNHSTGYHDPRIAVQAIAEYQRSAHGPWTVVVLLTRQDGDSGFYYVTETSEEIDALICAAQGRA